MGLCYATTQKEWISKKSMRKWHELQNSLHLPLIPCTKKPETCQTCSESLDSPNKLTLRLQDHGCLSPKSIHICTATSTAEVSFATSIGDKVTTSASLWADPCLRWVEIWVPLRTAVPKSNHEIAHFYHQTMWRLLSNHFEAYGCPKMGQTTQKLLQYETMMKIWGK